MNGYDLIKNIISSLTVFSIIKGSDVILIDDLQETDTYPSNFSEKNLLSKRISFSKNYVDIEFSFKYTSENSIKLNKCSKNDQSKGFFMFLMSGKLDDKFNILFETATIPKIFGPFCLNSCSSNLSFLKNMSIKNQEKKQAINLSNKLKLDIEKSINKNISTTKMNIHISNLTTNRENLQTNTSEGVYEIVENSTINLSTPISINLTTGLKEINYTQISTENHTTNTDNLVTTKIENIYHQTTKRREDLKIFQDAAEVFTTTSHIFTPLSISFCSNQVQNLSNINLTYFYDHRVKTLNYTLAHNLNFSFIRIGVFNINPLNKVNKINKLK